MRSPSRAEVLTLGPAIAILAVLGLLVAVVGPHPTYLLHRVLPFESGPGAVVGTHFNAPEEMGILKGDALPCVGNRRSCKYVTALDLNPRGDSSPRVLLWRTSPGPYEGYRVDVLAAARVPSDLAPTRLWPTDQRDVVALPGDRDADGWYTARTAWRADTHRWTLDRIDPAGVRAYEPFKGPTGPLPARPQLYAALVDGPFVYPADIKRPETTHTDYRERGFEISHLYDVTENKDVLVTVRNAEYGVVDVAVAPHDADVRVVYGLMSDGRLRGDLVGLLSTTASEPDVVQHAWHLTKDGKLDPVPSTGLTCRQRPPGGRGPGPCASNDDNLLAIRGKP